MEKKIVKLCNEYIDLLKEANYFASEHILKELKFSKNKNEINKQYEKIQKKIVTEIRVISKRITDINAFRISVFCMRNVSIKQMYDNRLEDSYTFKFRVLTIVFWVLVGEKQKNNKSFNRVEQRRIIQNILNHTIVYINNLLIYNELNYHDHKKNEMFFRTLKSRSREKGDMYTYPITNSDLIKYMTIQGYTEVAILKMLEEQMPDFFFETNDKFIELYNKEISKIHRDTESDFLFDIVPKENIKYLSSKIQNFFRCFSLNNQNILSENGIDSMDFIFIYEDEKNIYIAKEVMKITQMIFRDFALHGQYQNLLRYFYPKINLDSIKNLYNKIMTFKIADLLIQYYQLPMERKKINNVILNIPRVEINDYPGIKEDGINNGDIDIMFYSHIKKTLYLIEYKNYEMFVTIKNALENQEKKLKRDVIFEKVEHRQEVIDKHISEIMKKYFKIKCDTSDIQVHSIILSTKPHFGFDIQYKFKTLDWVEFENCVKQQDF